MKRTNIFELWLQTDCGQKCQDYYSLLAYPKGEEYLKNRLYHAYSAGLIDKFNSNKIKIDQLNQTLEYYENKLQALKAELQEKDRQLRELQPQPLASDSPS